MEFDRLCVVLVAARNPLNIGAAARAMSNFGVRRLRVVNSYDLPFREARSAVGAATVLTDSEEFKTLAEAVADCTLVVGTASINRRQPQHPLHPLAAGAILITEELQAQERTVAILFGSEKFGLSNEHLSHCHWLMHIPTSDEQPSMNLAQAVAVCLYELARRDGNQLSIASPSPASSGDLERMTVLLLETLHASGYIEAQSAESKEESIRRMARRLHLSREDATAWQGMLRQILWKLRSKP